MADNLTTGSKKFLEFLKNLSEEGRPLEAAERAGIEYTQVEDLMARDERAQNMLDLAKRRFAEVIERELFNRSVKGYDEIVYYRGTQIGKKRVVSDTCLLAFARRHISAYKDHQQAVAQTGAKSGVLAVPSRAQKVEDWMEHFKKQGLDLEEEDGPGKKDLERGS